MAVNVGVIRTATEGEVKSRKHNIYLGISLGNKWFNKENMREYLLWALKYTKDRVAFLVADTLHAINYEVRNKTSPVSARRRALRMGDTIISVINEIVAELPQDQQQKIDVVRWDTIEKSRPHEEMRQALHKEFDNNPDFREKITEIVDSAIAKEEKRFSEEGRLKLTDYVLDELPEVLNGFSYRGTYYDLYIYPDDSLLTQFVEKIQKKEAFPHLHEKFCKKGNIFVELKVV